MVCGATLELGDHTCWGRGSSASRICGILRLMQISMTRVAIYRSLLAGCMAMGALTGCARAIAGGSDAQDRAMDDARKKAGQVVDAIDRDYVYKADGYAHSAAQVDGVEVMKVDGTLRNSGDGVTLVIRVHGIAPAANGSGPVDLPVCF